MSKKYIVYIVGLLVCLSIGILLFFPSSEKGSGSIEKLQAYKVEVREKNQALTSSVLIDGKLIQLKNEAELSSYLTITFNQTHDILWALCKTGFNIKSASSPSNNQVYIDDGVGANTELYKDKENIIIVECINASLK